MYFILIYGFRHCEERSNLNALANHKGDYFDPRNDDVFIYFTNNASYKIISNLIISQQKTLSVKVERVLTLS